MCKVKRPNRTPSSNEVAMRALSRIFSRVGQVTFSQGRQGLSAKCYLEKWAEKNKKIFEMKVDNSYFQH